MMSPHRCLCGFFAVDHPFMDADSRISTSALSASIAASMATAAGYRPAGSTRRLPIAHEIARHGKDEVGVGVVHLGQEFVYRLHRDVGPALKQLGTQVFRMVPGMDDCGFRINGPVSQLGASRSVDRVPTMGRTGLGSHTKVAANR
jgi:hypothetical protein